MSRAGSVASTMAAAVGLAWALTAAAQEPLVFEKLPHVEAGQLHFSEDGRTLAILCADQVVFHDVLAGRQTARFKTPQPEHCLWRDGRFHIANKTAGTISVLDASGKLVDELAAGGKDIVRLSAAAKEHFNHQFLVSMANREVFLVEAKGDRRRKLTIRGPAWVDHAGRLVQALGVVGGATLTDSVCRYEDVLAGTPLVMCERQFHIVGVQPHGLPFFNAPAYEDKSMFVDAVQPIGYRLRSLDRLQAERLGLPYPAEHESRPIKPETLRQYDHIAAATVEEQLHIYVCQAGDVLRCRTRAFFQSRSGQASRLQQLPLLVEAGREFDHQFQGSPTARYTLRKGPLGATLSPEGRLKWTPAQEQLGSQEFRIVVTDGDDLMPVNWRPEVVRQVQSGSAPAAPTAPEAVNELLLVCPPHLTWGLEGRCWCRWIARAVD